jgi:hypothetical protein
MGIRKVGYKPRYMWSQDPKKSLLSHLDILVYPGQVWEPYEYGQQEEDEEDDGNNVVAQP